MLVRRGQPSVSRCRISQRYYIHCLCLLLVLVLLLTQLNKPTANVSPGMVKSARKDGLVANRVKHDGSFGLGHRLSKLSACFDLAANKLSVVVPILQVEWQECGREMFGELFGDNQIVIRETTRPEDFQSKVILVRNDVHGYYAGQAYKNQGILVTPKHRSEWLQKMDRDHSFFVKLFDPLFQATQAFRDGNNWHNRHVIGVHVRAGNGETDHFVAAGRGTNLTDPTTVARKLEPLIQHAAAGQKNGNKPLVFLATDTASWVDALQSSLQSIADFVVYPQDRVASGKGVSYQQWTEADETCVRGWKSAVADMALLAQADTLVATSRSTFTQIVPALIVLKRNGGSFCEFVPGSVDCFSDVEDWLFGKRPHAHKLMVHLPDLDVSDTRLSAASAFLSSRRQPSPEERVYLYGPKFNKRYRQQKEFQSNWNLHG